MGESEHSDSEFYYPGELSDAEMLQLLTHNEATERKSLLSKRSNAAAHQTFSTPRLRRRRRAYAPTSNIASHDNHEKKQFMDFLFVLH